MAIYRGADGEPLRPREGKLAQLIGGVEKIDGIYCLNDDGEYAWVYAGRDGRLAHAIARTVALAKKEKEEACLPIVTPTLKRSP